jgi:DNA helicase-2/ATP-dependent DNA helicase PcrA
MVSHSEEVNRFAYVPKDWTDELSSQHREEYKDVVVVFDDIEAAWNNYSFAKTLTPDTSGSPTEGQYERSRKLAYVCFSRAEENLRVLLFTQNPESAMRELISNGIFKEAQISIAS